MKICSKCPEPALANVPWCLLHRREYDRERYQTQKVKRRVQIDAHKQRIRTWMDALKASTPCTDCSTKYPAICMDWDHTSADKVAHVSDLMRLGAIRKVREEIKKCELVCANCHRLRTQARYLLAREGMENSLALEARDARIVTEVLD